MQTKDYENRINNIIINQKEATIFSIQYAYEQLYNKFLNGSFINVLINHLIKQHKIKKIAINKVPYYYAI